MKINFTKKEYRLLLEFMYLGDWMMSSQLDEVKYTEDNEHNALYQKIFSHAKEMGFADNMYFETRIFEELMDETYVDPYDEECFWEVLIRELAQRDAIEQMGEAVYAKLDPMERIKILYTYEKQYRKEFEDFGLSRLKLHKYNA